MRTGVHACVCDWCAYVLDVPLCRTAIAVKVKEAQRQRQKQASQEMEMETMD